MKPLKATLFANKPGTFQQNSAPAHKAKSTKEWLKNNVLEFISMDQWPSGSSDLFPFGYKLWSVLESMDCSTRHLSIESLKRTFARAVGNFSKMRCVLRSMTEKQMVAISNKLFYDFLAIE